MNVFYNKVKADLVGLLLRGAVRDPTYNYYIYLRYKNCVLT